jgi:alanyl-tRNA synthetase
VEDKLATKELLVSANETIEIIDTKKENNLILHFAKQLPENVSASFVAKVNTDLRTSTSKNHSATHLMHLALRNILGTHVEQKGSLVNPNYLRFDFSHFSKVSDEELRQVEASVNAQIEAQLQLQEYRNIPIQEALEAKVRWLCLERNMVIQ